MKHFLYFSEGAATSGKALSGDLMKAGRMDIAINVIIQSIFLSHSIRDDVHLHLIFNGYGKKDILVFFGGGAGFKLWTTVDCGFG